jgi:hypothetical protein
LALAEQGIDVNGEMESMSVEEISIFPQVKFHEIFRNWGLRLGLFRTKIRNKNGKKIK